MEETSASLANLVSTLVLPLVDNPDDVEISSFDEEDGFITIEIQANPDDVGKVIGRHGRVIQSIRTLVRAAASKSGASVNVELVD